MSDLVRELEALDAKATKGPWTCAYGGGIEIDRFGRELPNPKPYVAEAHDAPAEGLCIARSFERARKGDAEALVALRNALPALIEYVKERTPETEAALLAALRGGK